MKQSRAFLIVVTLDCFVATLKDVGLDVDLYGYYEGLRVYNPQELIPLDFDLNFDF